MSYKIKIGLSKHKHLPCLLYAGHSFPLWQYPKVRRVEKFGLKLDCYGFSILVDELESFKYYLPPYPLKGLTVLDIGACCGETAWYFLKQGAEKVICIELDKLRADLIEQNRVGLNLNIQLIHDSFKPEYLQLPHDLIKCDIEGAEVLLLPYVSSLKPCVLEAHGEEIKKQFLNAGFNVIFQPSAITWLMTNIGGPKT